MFRFTGKFSCIPYDFVPSMCAVNKPTILQYIGTILEYLWECVCPSLPQSRMLISVPFIRLYLFSTICG